MDITRHCIVCHAQLCGAADHQHVEDYVNGGVACTTSGNYGSSVFDPGGNFLDDNVLLEICICDTCLRANAGYINTIKKVRQPTLYQHKLGIHDTIGDDDGSEV